MTDRETTLRKQQQLHIVLQEDVQSDCGNGFGRYQFVHTALPEIALQDVDLSTQFLGHPFSAPFFIQAMTGGVAGAESVNRNIAAAAEKLGIGLCVGSQRAMIEDSRLAYTYQLRDLAPHAFVAGNLGAVQLCEYGVAAAIRLVDEIGADALFIHLNPAHEAAQPCGDTDWRGVSDHIARLCAAADFPVLIKETGYGLSGEVAAKLEKLGVRALDVGGKGGTCWTKVESLRTSGDCVRVPVDWGIRTADSLVECRAACGLPLIGTGGIRDGHDAAKAIVLGASLVGMAQPLLAPAMESADAVVERLLLLADELRTVMFLVAASDLTALRRVELVSAASLATVTNDDGGPVWKAR